MRELKKEGKTIFFSSHILEDAQRIADRVGIIHKGRLLASGTLDELLQQQAGWDIEISSTAKADAAGICSENNWKHTQSNGHLSVKIEKQQDMKELYSLAAEGKIIVNTVNANRLNLEEAFLKEVSEWQD